LAATNYYCTIQNVIDRLTQAGVLFAVDPTGQGTINDPIVQSRLTEGLNEAKRQIDRALQPTWLKGFPIQQDDQNLNPHLQGWAVKIAAFYVATNGGHGVSGIIKDDYVEARQDLDKVQSRKTRIPGLVYGDEGWINLRVGMGKPMAANPHCGHGHHAVDNPGPWIKPSYGESGPTNGTDGYGGRY
jgi:hypothetical protein